MASEKILIVDDKDDMRRLLSRVLTREGYDTVAVGSGAEALRLVANERFDHRRVGNRQGAPGPLNSLQFTAYVHPLRSRREDIEPLTKHFLEKYSAETGKKITELTPRDLSCLLAYDWPGNIRELQNAIERAVVLAKSSVLTPRDFPPGMQGDDQICLQIPEKGGSLTDILEDLERQLILQTLQREDGSQTRAADTLGIKRTTLRYKMEKYRLID